MEKVRRGIRKIDLLGYYPQLYIEQKTTYNTATGGCISIGVIIIIIYLLTSYIMDSFVYRIGNITSFDKIRNDVPVYELNPDNWYNLTFGFFDQDFTLLSPNEDEIEIKYQNLHYFYDKQAQKMNNEIANEYSFQKCTDLDKDWMEELPQIVKENISKALCSSYTEQQKLGGSLLYEGENYQPTIYVGPKCKDIKQCTPEELNKYIGFISKTMQLSVLVSYYIPIPSNNKKFKEKVLYFENFDIKNLKNKVDLLFKEVILTTDDTYIPLFGSAPRKDNFMKFDTFSKVGYPIDKSSYSSLVNEFKLTISSSVYTIDRYYLKLDTVVSKFFSLYLMILYGGTILRGLVHTYNLERFLINYNLINEATLNIKNDGNDIINTINNELGQIHIINDSQRNSRSNQIDDFSNHNNLNLNLLNSNNNNNDNNNEIRESVLENSNLNSLKELNVNNSLNKLQKLKLINKRIKKYKVKVGLMDRYKCASLPKEFAKHVKYLYSILDTNNMIKMCLQFEKLKNILFTEKQKIVFEHFAISLDFLDDPLYGNNLDSFNDQELSKVIDALEAVNSEQNAISLSLIKQLPENFKEVML